MGAERSTAHTAKESPRDLHQRESLPNTAIDTARDVFRTLIGAGIRDLVLSPGSRSAPLAYAAAEAEASGKLRIHVRIDERSAGFLALGMAQASGAPVAIAMTSGTAVGQLLPAIMEANHTATALLVLSADRPEELQGTGASQTTDQRGLFGVHVRANLNVSAGTSPTPTVYQALRALAGTSKSAPGPVQLNLQFRDPLTPPRDSDLGAQQWAQQIQPGRWAGEQPNPPRWVVPDALTARRTVVLAGHDAGPEAQAFAQALGLPLLAEPSSNARFSAQLITHYRLLLTVAGERIERVVLFGRPTLSRPVARLLANHNIPSVLYQPRAVSWYAPGRRRERLVADPAQLIEFAGTAPKGWLDAWRNLDAQAQRIVRDLQPSKHVNGYQLAQLLWRHRQGPLFIGSSNIVRDFDLAAAGDDRPGARVYANRGLAGIDGSISTALGLAIASGQPTRAVLGDITFLHEASALLLAPDEPRPTLDVVVYNDAGGAIFSTLEHGAVHESGRYGQAVERLFATPHTARLDALAQAYEWKYYCPQNSGELEELLAAPQRAGVRLIEVRAPREQVRAQSVQWAEAVGALTWPER